jgi:FkbM family methyltransferase
LHAKLQAQQQNNGDERVRFLNFAICGADEPVMLQVSGYITSSTITRGDIPDPQGTVVVPGKTLATFFSEQGIDRVDLMKIDIEGAEVGVFESTSDEVLRRIRQMSIEFHDEHGFMTRQQFEQIRTRLLDLGFCGIKFSSNNTNWLFFRPEVAGPITRAYVRYLVRNARGALRRAGLRFG